MEKSFFDVFPKLNLDKKSSELFEQVTVCKVSATKSRDFVRVSIVSDYLIPKETIYKVEKEIKRQFLICFSGRYRTRRVLRSARDWNS